MAAIMLCSTPLIASENNAIPQRFHARIGGFLGDTYEVQLQDGCLQYTRFGGAANPSAPACAQPWSNGGNFVAAWMRSMSGAGARNTPLPECPMAPSGRSTSPILIGQSECKETMPTPGVREILPEFLPVAKHLPGI
jgi:hypothetical protein